MTGIGGGGRPKHRPSLWRRSWANRRNNCYISHMSNEKHFHGWLRSGRVFVMSPKVFTDRIACHRWAKRQRPEVDDRLVLACSKCPESRHRGGGRFGGAMWPERSASRSRRSGRRLRRNGGGPPRTEGLKITGQTPRATRFGSRRACADRSTRPSVVGGKMPPPPGNGWRPDGEDCGTTTRAETYHGRVSAGVE